MAERAGARGRADAQTIEVHRLDGTSDRLETRLEGGAPRALPPFPDLTLDPAAIGA